MIWHLHSEMNVVETDIRDDLLVFGKHVPRALRQQIITQLVEQYLAKDNNTSETHSVESIVSPSCFPSIQRFHCALLFVDISGFTALSLKLDVNDLKTHINNYFTIMLDIIANHGGDVIKFAGGKKVPNIL